MRNPVRDWQVPKIPGIVGLAGLAIMLLGVAFGAGQAPPAEDPIFTYARTAVAEGRTEKSKLVGSDEISRQFSELPGHGAILIGFDLGVGKSFDKDVVYAIRALYRAPDGDVSYQDRGLFNDKRLPGIKKEVIKTRVIRTEKIQAAAGYAVGGMTLRRGLIFDGMSVTFMRIKGKALDPQDSYTSKWVGSGGGSENKIIGKGAPVLGIFGTNDDTTLTGLGLHYGLPAAAVTKPPVDKPKLDPPVDKKIEVPVEKKVDPPVVDPPVAKQDQPVVPAEAPQDLAETTSWRPYVIFAAVAVPVFLVLLFVSRQKEAGAAEVRRPVDRPARARVGMQIKPGAGPQTAPPPGARDPEAITASPPPAGMPLPPRHEPAYPPREAREELDHASAWADRWLSRQEEGSAEKSIEFGKAAQQVAMTLFAIAAMQFVCGLIMVNLLPTVDPRIKVSSEALTLMITIVIGIAVVFAGLGWWAWYQPFLAGSFGLLIYLGITYLDYKANPELVMKGILVKVAIIAALVRAVTVAANVTFAGDMERVRRRFADEPERDRPPRQDHQWPRPSGAPYDGSERSQPPPRPYERERGQPPAPPPASRGHLVGDPGPYPPPEPLQWAHPAEQGRPEAPPQSREPSAAWGQREPAPAREPQVSTAWGQREEEQAREPQAAIPWGKLSSTRRPPMQEERRSSPREERPEWVKMGLWGIHDRLTAWVFFWIAVLIAIAPTIYAVLTGNAKYYLAIAFLLAALWYYLCIKWMDEHRGW